MQVKIWDLKKKGLQHTLKGHFSQVNSVTWNNLDSLVASCSNAGEIIIHNLATQLQIANFTLNAKTPGFKCLRFSPLRKSHLVSGSNDGSVTIWDVTMREQVAHFNAQHSSKVTAIACSLFNENLICSSGIDQKVHFYDLAQKKYPSFIKHIESVMRTLQCDNPLTALAFHNDGHSIAVGTLYGSIFIYDLRQTQQPKKQLKGHENSSVNFLEFVRPSEEEKIQLSMGKKESSIMSTGKSFKDENLQPVLRPSPNQSIADTEKKLDVSKTSMTALEEIKRETLQRLEQSKQEKARIQSQKPPAVAPPPPPQSAAKDSGSKSYTQIRQTFENYSGKIEDLNKKYDRPPPSDKKSEISIAASGHVQQQSSGQGFSDEQKKYLNELLNEHLIQVKHYVADQVGSLHIDMIRQFQIQQNDFQGLFDRYLYDQNLLTQRILQLEQENNELKRTSY